MDTQSEVADLIVQIEKTHRYSMSKIYALSNKVFNKNETPQSCASCLIRKVRELKNWLNEQNTTKDAEDTPQNIKTRKRKTTQNK